MKTEGGQVSLGAFATHVEAQRVVDHLADREFDVRTTQIIGSDLRMVEQITGRLTWPRAVLAGMAGGAWFGVFVGLVLSYGLTMGRRDFTSLSATVPSRFEVLVVATHADRARTVLATA